MCHSNADATPSGAPRSTSYLARLIRNTATILTWYCLSSTIILCTKWLFTNHFSFPLTVTTFSNTITTIWAFAFSRHPRFRPQPLTRRQFQEYVLPIGVSTALEIGFSNIALKLLTVSFGTILKGGAPIFTMLWGLVFGIEKFSLRLMACLLTIGVGIALASLGEGHEFVVLGFILQLLATALGGLRWAMTHVLLQGGASNSMPPLTATLYTSPTTALCVFPFALALEGRAVRDSLPDLAPGEQWLILSTMLIIASLVFFLLISEYWLVSATSSLALSVAGVFKELITIAGGVIFFAETVSTLNVMGFIVCQIGILFYLWIRYDPDHGRPTESSSSEVEELPLAYRETNDDEENFVDASEDFMPTKDRIEVAR